MIAAKATPTIANMRMMRTCGPKSFMVFSFCLTVGAVYSIATRCVALDRAIPSYSPHHTPYSAGRKGHAKHSLSGLRRNADLTAMLLRNDSPHGIQAQACS